jgi:hypothetical protein
MTFLGSLDAKDRKLLVWSVAGGLVLAVVAGVFLPRTDDDDNPMPSSYLAGKHGALAAYDLLDKAGYKVERWERPLGELAAEAGPKTVVIFAEPFSMDVDNIKAVRAILEKGARVVATGSGGGYILPGGRPVPSRGASFAACKLEPEGVNALASSGEVWMVPDETWDVVNPAVRVDYGCGGEPAVVEYDWGDGHVVWWASSTPLENGSVSRGQNLDFLLNSLGDRDGHRFYWDESLHGEFRSSWSFASGPALTLTRIGLPVLALLVLFSFSRRSGPVRELAAPVRTTPIEFLEALGSLYGRAGAASTAVEVAWERFRRHALELCGRRLERMDAAELAALVRRRFPMADAGLEGDLAACEAAADNERLHPKEALRLVQLLAGHVERLDEAVRSGVSGAGRVSGVRRTAG